MGKIMNLRLNQLGNFSQSWFLSSGWFRLYTSALIEKILFLGDIEPKKRTYSSVLQKPNIIRESFIVISHIPHPFCGIGPVCWHFLTSPPPPTSNQQMVHMELAQPFIRSISNFLKFYESQGRVMGL